MNPVAYLHEVKNRRYANRLLANAALTVKAGRGTFGPDRRQRAEQPGAERPYPFARLSELRRCGRRSTSTRWWTSPATTSSPRQGLRPAPPQRHGRHHPRTERLQVRRHGNRIGIPERRGGIPTTSTPPTSRVCPHRATPTGGCSFLGRINYNFDNRYLLTVNFRADGSSPLQQRATSGLFPLGGRRLAHFAGAVPPAGRLAFGPQAARRIRRDRQHRHLAYSTQNTLESVNVVFDKTTTVGYAPKNTYHRRPALGDHGAMERGPRPGAAEQRIRLTADYYHKKTTNLLNDVEMPRSSGYTTALRNVGAIGMRASNCSSIRASSTRP